VPVWKSMALSALRWSSDMPVRGSPFTVAHPVHFILRIPIRVRNAQVEWRRGRRTAAPAPRCARKASASSMKTSRPVRGRQSHDAWQSTATHRGSLCEIMSEQCRMKAPPSYKRAAARGPAPVKERVDLADGVGAERRDVAPGPAAGTGRALRDL
jgi:hypothetical protein